MHPRDLRGILRYNNNIRVLHTTVLPRVVAGETRYLPWIIFLRLPRRRGPVPSLTSGTAGTNCCSVLDTVTWPRWLVATQESGSAWIAAAVVGLLEHFFSMLPLINVRWYFILSLWDGTRWNSFVMDVYSYTWLLNLVHLGIKCNNCSIWTANLHISLKSSRFSISPTKGHSFSFPQGFADVFNISK